MALSTACFRWFSFVSHRPKVLVSTSIIFTTFLFICKDIVIVEQDDKGRQMYIFIECKFSASESTTALGQNEVADKIAKAEENIAAYHLDFSQCFLIFAPFRPHNIPLIYPAKCTALILSTPTLRNLYSPSLSSRPQFIRSQQKQNHKRKPTAHNNSQAKLAKVSGQL